MDTQKYAPEPPKGRVFM